MDSGNKLKSRTKKVVSGGKGVKKHGEGLGTGPVGNAGEYRERQEQESQRTSPASILAATISISLRAAVPEELPFI